MRITRTVAVTLSSLALAAGTAVAVPAVAGAAPATATPSVVAPHATDTWLITVKRTTYPTIQSERDRVMHDAANHGWTTTFACSDQTIEECQDSFLVSNVAYRTVVAHYRYDEAIVSIVAAG